MAQPNTKDEFKPVPIYTLRDEETPDGEYTLLKIRQDSAEGRTYAELTTDDERLSYMRAHFHDKVGHVTAQYSFLGDVEKGKRYLILRKSPECDGWKKFLRDDGTGSWPPESKESEALVGYYRENAHVVQDLREAKIDCGAQCKKKVDGVVAFSASWCQLG